MNIAINIDGPSVFKIIGVLIALTLIANFVRLTFSIGLDDTDKSTWHRSGLKVYRDNKTGVEYVGASNGGLCVRVDEQGKPSIPADILSEIHQRK